MCIFRTLQSKEEVLERIRRDPYFKGNVWDPEQVKVYPFLQAPLKKE